MKGTANIAFRFGVDQADKLRACGDLRRNTANLYCTVWTPIKLPTWDRLSQLCLNIRTSDREWAFFKADRQAAYKKLPLAPEHQRLAMVALRDPVTDEWKASPPKALLFGATSAVLHYNCFPRLLAALVNMTFGITISGYFDDFGALAPEELADLASSTFERFSDSPNIRLKASKTKVGAKMVFLGLKGSFPRPSNSMTLKIPLRGKRGETGPHRSPGSSKPEPSPSQKPNQ